MKKNNNKGFTMVELIIVIAILAILMVALVPQFIKYVESARESTDIQTARNIENAVEVACIDPDVDVTYPLVVTWDTADETTGAITITQNNIASAEGTEIYDALKETLGDMTINPSSSAAAEVADMTVTVKYTAESGSITVENSWADNLLAN